MVRFRETRLIAMELSDIWTIKESQKPTIESCQECGSNAVYLYPTSNRRWNITPTRQVSWTTAICNNCKRNKRPSSFSVFWDEDSQSWLHLMKAMKSPEVQKVWDDLKAAERRQEVMKILEQWEALDPTPHQSNIKTSTEEIQEVELVPRATPCPTCKNDQYRLREKHRRIQYIPIPNPTGVSVSYEVLVERAKAHCPNGCPDHSRFCSDRCLGHETDVILNPATSKWQPEKIQDASLDQALLNEARKIKMLHDNGDHRRCISTRYCQRLQALYPIEPEVMWKNFVDLALDGENNESV